MRKRAQIIDDISRVTTERNEARELLVRETRTTTIIEERAINQMNTTLTALNTELQQYDDHITALASKTPQENPQRSIISRILEARNSGESSIEIETRAVMQATGTDANGKLAVGLDHNTVAGPIRNALVAVQAGAKMITGLTKDQIFPVYSGVTCLWAGETAPASDGSGTLNGIVLKPKRITTQVTISKQLLIQDSIELNALITQDIRAAVLEKLEQTIFGKHAQSTTIPDGIFTGTAPTNKGAATYERLVMMMAGCKANGNLSYVISRPLMAKLMTMPKMTTSPYPIFENNLIAGIPTFVTNAVADGFQTGADEYGVVVGDFSEMIIGEWGNMDITVDNVTKAGSAEVVLTVNAYYDFAIRRSTAFATATMK